MANLKVSEQAYPTTRYTEAAAPSTPAAGEVVIYAKADGNLYQKDDAGTETLLANAASGAVGTDAIWDAKGDLAAGTGANTASKLTVGANDTILMADSAQSTGLKWVASQTPSTQAFSDAAAEGTADTYARGDHKHGMPASPGGGGAKVWLQRQTANNTSQNMDFTSFISSTYDTYLFVFNQIRPATDNTNFLMRVGTGGTPTWDTGSQYAWAGFRNSSTGTAVAGASTSAPTTSFGIDGNSGIDNGTGSTVNGTLRLFSPSLTTAPFVTSQVGFVDNTGSSLQCLMTGSYRSATAITAVRFLAASGNITSGTIDCYGITHA